MIIDNKKNVKVGDILKENIIKVKTGFKDTLDWNKLYNFQKDGVLGTINKLKYHNGCIIVDNVDNIKPVRTSEDLLYEILLKYGLDLTLPIEEKTTLERQVFIIGFEVLVVCFDNETISEIVEIIAEYQSAITRVVFKDGSLKNTVAKTNAIQILKQNDIDEIVSI